MPELLLLPVLSELKVNSLFELELGLLGLFASTDGEFTFVCNERENIETNAWLHATSKTTGEAL